MKIEGAAFAIVGALEAFPRRLAAREIKARGGMLRHGLSRQTRFAVFGHGLIKSASAQRVAARIGEALQAGALPLSENGFLRLLKLAAEPEGSREFSSRQIVEQSGLDRETFERLLLFDAFESTADPFGFRDLVAARRYAKLLAGGADWVKVLRDGGPTASSSAQLTLALPLDEPDRLSRLFDEADEAEEAEDWERAASLYRRGHEMDSADPVIAFNLSHALLKLGDWREARRYLNKVLKLDPGYAEAWYNLASIARDQQDHEAAKRHLRKAITADPGYPDPLYNLALLEFDAGDYERATRLWEKYLELDSSSPWGQKARYGLQLIGMIIGHPESASEVRAASDQLRVVR